MPVSENEATKWARRGSEHFLRGSFDEAANCFELAYEAEPGSPLHLCNLAACKLELGDNEEVVLLATRALDINPGLAAAYANRADALRITGDIGSAVSDYRSALALDPRNPVMLNKAGSCLLILEQFDGAREHFERALKIAPSFGLARLNLGLYGIVGGKPSPAIKLIEEALLTTGLDAESRDIGETALRVLGEHRRIQPALERALAESRPGLMTGALRFTPAALLTTDHAMASWLEGVAASCRELPATHEPLAYRSDTRHLLFLEACAHARFDKGAEAEARLLEQLLSGDPIDRSDTGRRLATLHDACRERLEMPLELESELELEAWTRYWHARLLRDHPEAYPGQFKPIPNLVGATDPIEFTPPGKVVATVRYMFSECWRAIPGGIPRAVFALLAINRIHPFKDGNGRTARFLMNRELESCGLESTPVFPSMRKGYFEALNESYAQTDARIMYENLLVLRRDADRRLKDLNLAIERL